MNKNKILVLFISLIFLSSSAFAGLAVEPAVVNFSADIGAVCENKYKVTNTEDIPVTVKVTKEDWKNSYDNNEFVTVDKWLELSSKEFDLAPGCSAEFPFKVMTYEGMSGSVSGMVVFSVQKGMIEMSMKMPVYITIRGTEKVKFDISSIYVARNEATGGIYYGITVKNDGNVHIRHKGSIALYDKDTNLVSSIYIGETYPTYSKTERQFNGILAEKGVLKNGKYKAVFKIEAFGKKVEKKVKIKITKNGKFVAK